MRIRLTLLLAAGCAAALAVMSEAQAGSRLKDRIYADSFGNLVVHSKSGYKRIVVGGGHLAAELSRFEDQGEPEVFSYDGRASADEQLAYDPPCKPVLLKGRSYMYGLPDGYLPAPGCDGLR